MTDIFRFIHVRPIDSTFEADKAPADKKLSTLAEDEEGGPSDGLRHPRRRLIRHAGGLLRLGGSPAASPASPAPAASGQAPALTEGFQRVAIGDFLAVEQQVARYEFGEIAHVENVMAHETRIRRHEQSTEQVEEQERSTVESEHSSSELSTSERFELSSAVDEVLLRSAEIGASTYAEGGFGGVSFGASFSADLSSTELRSDSRASTFARETVETAMQEITRQVAERRLSRRTTLVKEFNEHSFINGTAEHAVGIYRFLDKILRARLRNHGQRMMLEFMVPEPAAFLVYALAEASDEALAIEDPGAFDLKLSQIGEVTNAGQDSIAWSELAARYDAEGVEAPPPGARWISVVISSQAASAPSEGASPTVFESGEETITIPDGYRAHNYEITGMFSYGLEPNEGDADERVHVAFPRADNWIRNSSSLMRKSGNLQDNVRGSFEVAWSMRHKRAVSVEVTIGCVRDPEVLEAWRLDIWKKCKLAHQNRVLAYEARVAQAAQSGFSAAYAPSSTYRATERQELKRAAITMLTGTRFIEYGSYGVGSAGLPWMRIEEADREGANIRLLETAIDWDLMQYRFMPYFWAGRGNWVQLMTRDAYDPQYRDFLRAGAAQVVVPVNPEFQKAIALLMMTDWKRPLPATWQDEDILPGKHPIGDAYLALTEAQAQAGTKDDAVVVDEWEIRMPTELIILQEGGDPNQPPVATTP